MTRQNKRIGKLRILIFAVIAAVLLVLLSNAITNWTTAANLEERGVKPGTPDYSIEDYYYKIGFNNIEYNYALKDDFLFVLIKSIDDKEADSIRYFSSVGMKKSNGEYDMSMREATFFAPLSTQNTDYISTVQINLFETKTILLLNSLQDNPGVDNSKLVLTDQNGNELGKLSIDGSNFVVFYDVVENMTDDYAIYADYEGGKVLVEDAKEIKGLKPSPALRG